MTEEHTPVAWKRIVRGRAKAVGAEKPTSAAKKARRALKNKWKKNGHGRSFKVWLTSGR